MRKPVVLIFTNALILVAIFVLLAQSLVVAQRVARTNQVQGRAEIQVSGHGDFRPVTDEQPLKRGDVIRTGSNGMVEFRWNDGTRCKVMPNSLLAVKAASYNSIKGAEESRLRLTQGKLFVRIAKKLNQGSRFLVETPAAVTSVVGTIFSVRAEAGRTDVDVFRGRVMVSPSSTEGGASKARAVAVEQGRKFTLAPYGNVRSMQASDPAAFQAQASIIRPALLVHVEELNDGKGRLIIRTENGNTVKVNGEVVKPVGVGTVVRDVTLKPGLNTWKVESVDRHGLRAEQQATLRYAGAKFIQHS